MAIERAKEFLVMDQNEDANKVVYDTLNNLI